MIWSQNCTSRSSFYRPWQKKNSKIRMRKKYIFLNKICKLVRYAYLKYNTPVIYTIRISCVYFKWQDLTPQFDYFFRISKMGVFFTQTHIYCVANLPSSSFQLPFRKKFIRFNWEGFLLKREWTGLFRVMTSVMTIFRVVI